jgi:virginiamycin B lyase
VNPRLSALLITVAIAACSPTAVESPAARGPSPSASERLTSSAGTPASSASAQVPASSESTGPTRATLTEFPVPAGAHPHDVSPAPDGGVWYTGQRNGTLGHLDPETGEVTEIALPSGSAPHGVITGPDGAAWITDSGLNAIVRVDAATDEATVFPLPGTAGGANLNTAVFAPDGSLWFTGQSGFYGRLDPQTRAVEAFDAPRGRGAYGITTTPAGEIFYASLAGNHIAQVDPTTGEATVIEPPTAGQGARRVWSDSDGIIWVSEWEAGQVGRFDPATSDWREWRLPGVRPQAYAVFVDDRDDVWLTDFGANALVRFDPTDESFESFPMPTGNASVRQLHGRPGEVWGAESSTDKLVRVTLEPG